MSCAACAAAADTAQERTSGREAERVERVEKVEGAGGEKRKTRCAVPLRNAPGEGEQWRRAASHAHTHTYIYAHQRAADIKLGADTLPSARAWPIPFILHGRHGRHGNTHLHAWLRLRLLLLLFVCWLSLVALRIISGVVAVSYPDKGIIYSGACTRHRSTHTRIAHRTCTRTCDAARARRGAGKQQPPCTHEKTK